MQKVLIVDNSRAVKKVLQEMIASQLHVNTQVATTFAEAKKQIEKNPSAYFAAVVGLTLTDAPNGEIVDYVLAHHIPVIVLTASYTDEMREKMISKSIIDYVVKSHHHTLDQVVHLIEGLQQNRAIKVLVVDDSTSSRTHIRRLLDTYKYHTLEATNGEEALEVLTSHPEIKLIITDYNMPKMDGMELISRVRKEYDKEHLAIIGLSSSDDNSLSAKLLKCGANDFLAKPFSSEEFHCRITQNIEFLKKIEELSDRNKELSFLYAQLTGELEQARLTQHAIFPQQMPVLPGVRFAAKYVAMQRVGGDFYDVIEIDGQRVGLIIADVTGHGVSAALIAFMISGLVKNYAPKFTSSASTLGAVNQALYQKLPEDKYATAFYCIYDLHKKYITFSSAGHPGGYVIRPQEHQILSIQRNSIMLGSFPTDIAKYEDKSIKLMVGDKVFLYTDGITEITNRAGTMFGYERLEKFLLEHGRYPISKIMDMTHEYILNFSGKTQFDDDMTMLGMEVLF